MKRALLFLLIGSLASLAFKCGDKKPEKTELELNGVRLICPKDPNVPADMLCRVARVTDRDRVSPSGTHIWAEPGTDITAEEMQDVDFGLARTFSKSLCAGYSGPRALTHDQYTVVFLWSNRTDSQGNPAFRLPCDQYCGTEWDLGGYILASAQIVAVGEPHGNVILIPDPSGQREWLRNVSEYESEHAVLAQYDGAKFYATQTHTGGQGHPIWTCP